MPEQQSKADIIAERQSNLPPPEDPPVKSDWNSQSTSINANSDERQSEIASAPSDISTGDAASTGLREPASGGSGVREEGGADMSGVGRQGKDNLDGLPKDALAK